MASRSGGRNTAFRPQDRTITLVDDLDRMGCIGQDLHIATVDMEDETCLFRPLMVFCHIVIFSVRLSLFVSLGKRGIYELPYEVYINYLTQYISSGICSISSQKRPVGQASLPPPRPAELCSHGAVDDMEHGAVSLVSAGGRKI